MFRFAEPGWLLCFFLLPLAAWFMQGGSRRRASLQFSSLKSVRSATAGGGHPTQFLTALRLTALALVILALARPQAGQATQEVLTQGIDIILILDTSGSMQAEDFQPQNRLEVAKEEARRFILGRRQDRIGLVVFAKDAFTMCPATLDYALLTNFLESVRFGMTEDGTAIGTALVTAVNRLRQNPGKSKVAVLLTDGENNAGKIDPITASRLAHRFGVKVYAVAVGREGLVPFPVIDPILGKRYAQVETKIDEATLRTIAQNTGGQFFRARDASSLRAIYQEIDQLEKTEAKVKEYLDYTELFPKFLWPAFFLVVLEQILAYSVLRVLP